MLSRRYSRQFVILCKTVHNSAAMRDSSQKKDFKRLPDYCIPINYNLSLKPDLAKFTFAGKVGIKVNIRKETNELTLNALELDIKSASIILNGQDLPSSRIETIEADELAVITFNQALKPGEGMLNIDFTGILNDKMKGFYRSKYTSADGQEDRYGASTQFEATDARRAFPCWDEPALKATFDMTLTVPKNRIALSNMDVISEEEDKQDSGYKVVKFDTTPIMSTYLLACVVGEYDFVEDMSADGVKVRVYTPVGKKEQGLFALEVAVKALPYYKEYFNIPYPLPKMDLIAIADFASGAMENWGLVTYRETCILVDPQNTSADRKQWIALVVGHELAHQWFGNLVTMEWWTHLWLNEGFASFIEFLCVNNLFSDYDIWTQFATDVYTRALELDALNNSHAIEVPVGHPSEIDEIFDDISYNKGASVIRMLHRYIGDDSFKKGMNHYLTEHAYKNTVTEDLWHSLEQASKKPVAAVMSTWTRQKGFPVISVTSKQDGNNRVLTLTQDKFCADGHLPDSDVSTQWLVPISVSSALSPSKVVAEVLLESKSTTLVVENCSSDDWIKVNPSIVGFYRVQYTPEMLEQLLPAVMNKKLPPLDRLGLQNDLFAMVQAGRTSTAEALKLINAFVDEDNYTVWSSINACLGKLNVILSHTDFQDLFHAYGRNLLAKVYSRLGWEPIKGESHLDILLRSLVINRLASLEDPNVLSEAKRRFDAHCNGTLLISADLRSAIYRAVAINCDDKVFDSFFTLYRNADLHEEKDRISRALGAVKQPERISRVLDFAMSKEVRNQDSVFVIISVAMTKNGRDAAWEFFQSNREELQRRYESGHLISRLIKYVTENFASEEKAQEVERFFAAHQFPGAERTVQQSVETIRLNAAWLARDANEVKIYLTKQNV